MDPRKTGNDQVKGQNSFRVSSSESVYRKKEKKIEFHVVPSFWNPDPLVIDLFSPELAVTFLFVSFCVLRTWYGNHQVGDPKIWPDGNVCCTPFVTRYG